MAMLSNNKQAEINVTPMIDVLLVLLIIFMVIMPDKSHGLDAQAPQPSVSASRGPTPTVIQVAENHNIKINEHPIPWDNLDQSLQEFVIRQPSGFLFVAGTRDVPFEDVAHVIDLARGAGIHHIALMPRNK